MPFQVTAGAELALIGYQRSWKRTKNTIIFVCHCYWSRSFFIVNQIEHTRPFRFAPNDIEMLSTNQFKLTFCHLKIEWD